MTEFYVRNWMSTDPITIELKTNLSVAYHLMRLNKVRRLPVVDERDQLMGIITWGDLREARPKQGSRLDDWESRFLAATVDIQEIMTPNPITASPEMTMRDAVARMLQHKIRGLPVVDEENVVVGILTDSDVFRFLVEVLLVMEEKVTG